MVDDCGQPMHCRELCRLHYGRLYRTGTTSEPTWTGTCIACGGQFETRDGRQTYHPACKVKARRERQKAACAGVVCSVEGCGRRGVPGLKIALCGTHYRRQRLHGDADSGPPVKVAVSRSCVVDGCGRKYYAKNLCSMHYNRHRLTGDVGPVAPVKAAAGEGTFISEKGYVYVVHQDGAGKKGRRTRKIALHRLLMEQLLGRQLLPGETVHHCNTVRDDNRTDGSLDANFRSGNLELWTKSQPSGGRVVDKVAWAVELLELYAPELLADKPTQLRLLA